MALVTRDPAIYLDLAGGLRERRIPSVSLMPGQRIPARVSVVLTTPNEARHISHSCVLEVPENGDRRSLWAAVESALGSSEPDTPLIFGIDPGPQPGYAVRDGEKYIAEGILESPEAAASIAAQFHRRFPSRTLLFRVGSGARLARDRTVNALLAQRRPVEIVNERGTTPRGGRRPSDTAAARIIARTPGDPVRKRLSLTITPGEIANLQRLSREGSGGRFTISRALAHRVLEGELTFNEALREGGARYGSPRERSGFGEQT